MRTGDFLLLALSCSLVCSLWQSQLPHGELPYAEAHVARDVVASSQIAKQPNPVHDH